MKRFTRRPTIAIACLAGTLALGLVAVFVSVFWPSRETLPRRRRPIFDPVRWERQELLLKLKEGVDPWNEWREAEPEQVIDFSGLSLREADLHVRDLRRMKLVKADLRGANLFGTDFEDAELGGADLSDSQLQGANFKHADLRDAVLREADLRGANLRWANLREADLGGTDLTWSWGSHSRGDLYRANLTRASLSRANLADVDLTEASLRYANLTDADMSEANLFDADLTGANLAGTNLSGAQLCWANLENVSGWKGVRLKYANVFQVENAPDGFFEFATKNGAVQLDNEWYIFVRLSEAEKARFIDLNEDERAKLLKAKKEAMEREKWGRGAVLRCR